MSKAHHKMHLKSILDKGKYKPLCTKLIGVVKMLQFKVSQQHNRIVCLQEELAKKRPAPLENVAIAPACKKLKMSRSQNAFTCRWCSVGGRDVHYGYLKNLKRHLLEHHKCNEPGNEKYRYDEDGVPIVLPGETIYKYECLCCPKKFEEKRKLVKHMGIAHPEVDIIAYKTQRKTPATNFKLCEYRRNKFIKLVLK